MSENQEVLGFHLSDYQSEFVKKFLTTNSPPNHILSAPVGSGKTATSSAIVHGMVKSGAQRILILVPALVLVDQYKRVLSGIEQDINIISLDRKIIREINSLNQQETFWAKSVAIVALRQAANDEIKESILSIQWDLIIIDEFEHVVTNSKTALLLQLIAEKHIAKRILLLSNQVSTILSREGDSSFLNGKLLDRFEVTRWKRKDLFPSKSTREVSFNKVSYARTKDEIEFIKKYTGLSKWLANRSFQNKIRSRLVSSSLYAAEESLRSFRNRLVHDDLSNMLDINEVEKEFIKDEELLGDINSAQIDKKISSKDLPKLMNDLSIAFDLLDKIQVDSKFNTLLQVAKNIDTKKQKTWIYASYQSTISYLHSSLSELTENVYQIHGQMSSHHVAEYFNRFRNDGGILIASTSQLAGFELPIDNLILYDTPESENLIYTLFTRLSAPSREMTNEAVSLTVFEDTTNTLKAEQSRLRKLQGFLEQLIQEEM